MHKTSCQTIIVALLLFLLAAPGYCAVDSKPARTFKTDAPPLDTAITADGKWTFILTEGGRIRIYDQNGTLDDTITVNPEMDSLAISGSGEKLLLSSRRTKNIQTIDLTFVAVINNDDSPSMGPPQAPVTIVIFSDFQCPYCAKVGALLEYALEHNPETVRVVFKQFPLSFHKYAQAAAIASLAANNQGKFWAFHDLLFQHGKELSDQKIEALAKEAGLNMKRFRTDIKNELLSDRVAQDIQEGQRNGVRGTPTIFVNGRSLNERSPQGLQTLIDQELARTKAKNR
ncbi:MAG: thioredoxin domain-containing protein [Desulfobulbaceae bacterium]|nr:thioredoxin domain-containing protein [Desulfobulbaceae bacterium]